MKTSLHSIGIVGSGNIAFHLAKELCEKDAIKLIGIHSRNQQTGSDLALICKTDFYKDLNELAKKCQLILICSSDDSIPHLAKQINLDEQIIAHCSGMISIESLKLASPNYWKFLPLTELYQN
ncbi:MAG: NAD(P)-binding domain-containing protein [Chitinophagales bacterium]